VHYTGISRKKGPRKLIQGQPVHFDTLLDPQSNKFKAINVKIKIAKETETH
jgi:cold shock CspA family protein